MSALRARDGWKWCGVLAAIGLLGVAGCSKDEGGAPAKVISDACQEARVAMGDWLDVEVAFHQAVNDALGHWADMYNTAKQGISSDELDQMIADYNADLQTATSNNATRTQTYTAFTAAVQRCTGATPAVLPTACANELRHGDALAQAGLALSDAENAALDAVKATQDALVTGDVATINAAVAQGNAAADQHSAATDAWNEEMDALNAAVDACNAAIS